MTHFPQTWRGNAICCLFLMYCFSCPGFAQSPPPPAQALSSAQVARIEAAVKAWMAQTKAPALSVAIVTGNQMRWARGYGLADVENGVAAQAHTAYRLASLAKSLTAVAVMQLVEQGKLKLDEPIHRYCAAYPAQQALLNAPGQQFAITLRQVLVHQAGGRHNKFDELQSTRHYRTINDAVASFKDDPLVSEPAQPPMKR